MNARRDVFQAIADPNRRAIISLLAEKPMHLNGIAEKFDISRPAISQHIKLLEECGLIKVSKHGRERYCQIEASQLKEVAEWVSTFKKLWDKRLDKLEMFLKEVK
jgi:DNA-binding transcriptional ArsR family regulator